MRAAIAAEYRDGLGLFADLEEAINVCREGLKRQPAYPSARMTLGRALFDTGDLGAARAEFETVLKGAPDNILAKFGVASRGEAAALAHRSGVLDDTPA